MGRMVKGWRIITEGLLKTGLRDRGITSHLDRGVPVPLDIFDDEEDKEVYKNKVFHVWFAACTGYIFATANYTEDWRSGGETQRTFDWDLHVV